ncbi:MAG: hypothetical protein AB8B83_01515 [Bdellovibrionales bacterium]
MFKKHYYAAGAALTVGMIASSSDAHAAGKSFSDIATNIATSIASLPGLISGLAYLFGTLIGVLGIMKIKDHVENPTQTPLKDGAVRLAAGGGLFALPIIYDAMFTTIGTGNTTDVAVLKKVKLGV